MSLGFDHQQDEHAHDEQDEEEDDLAFGRLTLVPGRHGEFFVGRFDVDGHAFDVVINSVQHGPLIYDHRLELFEDVCELNDALCDIGDFTLPLDDGGVVFGERELFLVLGCLLQCRLRVGFVGVGFDQRWIGVCVLLWGR